MGLTYANLQVETAIFLGWDRTVANWTTANNTDFARILDSGLRQFLYPTLPSEEGNQQPVYEWSFLRKTGTITLATDDVDYTLPDDCGNVLDASVTNAVASARRPLEKVSESVWRKYRSMNDKNGEPQIFAVRALTHAPTTGHRFEFLVYPTPIAAQNGQVLTYRYISLPDTMTSTNLYHIGGARYSEVLRAAVLSAAESIIDEDPVGNYTQKFQHLLQSAIRADIQSKANERGGDV